MPHKPEILLEDIRVCADRIIKFTQGKSLIDYQQDDLLWSAVERNFMIIGEAMVRPRSVAPDVLNRITNYRKVIGFRNILVHGYEVIEDSTVWDAIHNHLPLLLREVEFLKLEANNRNTPK